MGIRVNYMVRYSRANKRLDVKYKCSRPVKVGGKTIIDIFFRNRYTVKDLKPKEAMLVFVKNVLKERLILEKSKKTTTIDIKIKYTNKKLGPLMSGKLNLWYDQLSGFCIINDSKLVLIKIKFTK